VYIDIEATDLVCFISYCQWDILPLYEGRQTSIAIWIDSI